MMMDDKFSLTKNSPKKKKSVPTSFLRSFYDQFLFLSLSILWLEKDSNSHYLNKPRPTLVPLTLPCLIPAHHHVHPRVHPLHKLPSMAVDLSPSHNPQVRRILPQHHAPSPVMLREVQNSSVRTSPK